MSSANHGKEVGAGLEDLLPAESFSRTSGLCRFGLLDEVEAFLRAVEDVVAEVEASEPSDFLSAFQLLPALAVLVLAGRFMLADASLNQATDCRVGANWIVKGVYAAKSEVVVRAKDALMDAKLVVRCSKSELDGLLQEDVRGGHRELRARSRFVKMMVKPRPTLGGRAQVEG